MSLYFLTFILCLFFETEKHLKQNIVLRALFFIFIFLFFCFGYMVGSDWRSYELDYNISFINLENFKTTLYPGYYILTVIFNYLSKDFFVFRAFVNIIYLSSVFYVTSLIFKKVNFLVVIFLSPFLFFMLFGGPLKFLCSSIFIMYATGYLLNNKMLKWLLLSSLSVFFHFSSIFIILLIFITWRFKKSISEIHVNFLLFFYFVLLILSSNQFFFNSLFSIVEYFLFPGPITNKIMGYKSIYVESVFSLGTLKNTVFFLLVIYHKNRILKFSRHGTLIFSFAVVFALAYRVMYIIPVGFRLTMYLSMFFYLAILVIFNTYSKNYNSSIKKIIIISLFVVPSFFNFWRDYQYLPYSNSFKYIITNSHLPYSYRVKYNYVESSKRTGIYYYEKN